MSGFIYFVSNLFRLASAAKSLIRKTWLLAPKLVPDKVLEFVGGKVSEAEEVGSVSDSASFDLPMLFKYGWM